VRHQRRGRGRGGGAGGPGGKGRARPAARGVKAGGPQERGERALRVPPLRRSPRGGGGVQGSSLGSRRASRVLRVVRSRGRGDPGRLRRLPPAPRFLARGRQSQASAGLGAGFALQSRVSAGGNQRGARSGTGGGTTGVSGRRKGAPPMTTTASGFCVCEPIAFDRAAGVKPSIATRLVIRTGRKPRSTPRRIPSSAPA